MTCLISLLSKGLSGAPQFKGISSLVLCLLYGRALTPVCDYWEDHSLDYMDLCWQSYVSAFQHTISVSLSFPAKKQSSSDFMAAITIHSDLRAQEEGIFHYIHLFPFYLPCTILWTSSSGTLFTRSNALNLLVISPVYLQRI